MYPKWERWHRPESWSHGLAVYVDVNRLKPKHPLCVSYALHRYFG